MNMGNEIICRCQHDRFSSIPDYQWGPEKFLLIQYSFCYHGFIVFTYMLLLYTRSEGYSFAKCTAMREFPFVLDAETLTGK
jgi:hypothetical protein